MTNPQVTQADRERAEKVAKLVFVEPWHIDILALELAKVRQEEQAKTDEAVAAVVVELRESFIQEAEQLKSRTDFAAYRKSVLLIAAEKVGRVKPNHQQILAERDKRVKEDESKRWERAIAKEIGAFAITDGNVEEAVEKYLKAALVDACDQQRDLRESLRKTEAYLSLLFHRHFDRRGEGALAPPSDNEIGVVIEAARRALGKKG